jgi:hypothetical protein
VADIFVKQLDGCTYKSGGFNCTCAVHAMWMYRASGGTLRKTACQVRQASGDTSGGTNLEQMQAVSSHFGVSRGTLYRPGLFLKVRDLVLTGRHAAHVQIGYRLLRNTKWDCFGGNFGGAHDLYVNGGDANNAHYADPGADGRRPGIPTGYQTMPWDLLERCASNLPIADNGLTVAQEFGSGRVYALVTPADPLASGVKITMQIDGYTPLYYSPGGMRDGAVSKATYVCTRSKVDGLWWYKIVSKVGGGKTANAGKFFKPTRFTRPV